MNDRKFIKCDCCDRKIYLGDEVFRYEGYCGIFCSEKCFADEYASEITLTEDECDNCGCMIYDESEIEYKKKEIEMKINELNKQLAELNYLT